MTLYTTTKLVSDVATTVRRQFGDESGVQVTDADIYRWINDGQKDIVVKNKVLKGLATVSSVAGTATYTLPSVDIAGIESIQYDGTPIVGTPYPEAQAKILGAGTDISTGVPLLWYEWAGTLTFWPVPDAIKTITILYVREPVAVTSLASALSLPDSYFNALVKYVLSQAYEMDENWDASNFKTQQLDNDLTSMADEERTTSSLTYPVINDVDSY